VHLLLIAIFSLVAWGIRLLLNPRNGHDVLSLFLIAPLLIFFTFLSVILMGSGGQMFGVSSSIFAYCLALLLVSLCLFATGRSYWQVRKALVKIREFPSTVLLGFESRIVDIDFPYSAQVGFWSSELVISRGLLEILSEDELKAVLAHEQAHRIYHDTFWFFLLEVIKSLSWWLPRSESLWQNLLLLREIRADKLACQNSDPFNLAQALLKVAQTIAQTSYTKECRESFSVAFHPNISNSHLVTRLESILEGEQPYCWSFPVSAILMSILPLFLIIWHSGS